MRHLLFVVREWHTNVRKSISWPNVNYQRPPLLWLHVWNLSFITNNHGVHPLFLCFYWFTQSYSTRLDWVMEAHHKESDMNAYWLLWREHNRKFTFSVNQTPFMSGLFLYCFHLSFISVLFIYFFYCWSHRQSTLFHPGNSPESSQHHGCLRTYSLYDFSIFQSRSYDIDVCITN